MSKFGVGVGDDFPVDDGSGQSAGGNQAPQDDRAEYEAWKRQRDAYRAYRDQRSAQREEWRSRKHAFKERVRAAARESFGQDDRDYSRGGRRSFGYGRRGFPLVALIPILGLVLVVSLIAAIIKSPFVFLILALAGFFFFAHRHHGHHFAGHWHDGREYDFDLKPSRGPQSPATDTVAPIVTPPPPNPPASPQDGGK